MKEMFTKYLYSTNVEGSGKASSYISALDWLCKLIQLKPFSFGDCSDIWSISEPGRLQELKEFVAIQKGKKEKSEWNIDGIPKSYLLNGYCSAALSVYQKFLVENNYFESLLGIFEHYDGDESKLPEKLDKQLDVPSFFLGDLDHKEGKDVIRTVRARANQNIFRSMILKIYDQSCCITGLNIPEINRASHIIPWSEDKEKRLDPRNGLCLSATYDAAFDRNLISLDDDYRVILSIGIKEHYSNSVVHEYFLAKEGLKINLPTSYLPSQSYLEKHRSKCEL